MLINKNYIKIFLNKYKYYLLFGPIFFNFLYNLFNSINIIFKNFNLFNLISTILFFLFLFFVGKNIKKSLNLESYSLGICIFLLSFFLLELFNILFSTNLKFEILIYINLIFWIILFFYKKNNYINIFSTLISFGLLRVFNNQFIEKFKINQNIEVDVWYYIEFSKLISNKGYLYSLENNIFTGYSQFSSYFHSVLHFLNYQISKFEYFQNTTNVLFFLSLLLIFEASNDLKVRILSLFLYISLTLNSEWLNFLMIDSLMSEGILNYLFATLLFSILIAWSGSNFLLFQT